MKDLNKKIQNRINKTYDLTKLWDKLRKEGLLVWEDEDYLDNEQAPYHLYHISKGYGVDVNILYRDKIEDEIKLDSKIGLKKFKQEIEWIEY